MSVFQKITGILSNSFQIGGPTGPKVANSSGDVAAFKSDGTTLAQVQGALLDGNPNALATWASVTKRYQIRASFDASGAAPTNLSEGYMICSVGGHGYTAGDLAFDNGTVTGDCIRIPRAVGMLITIQGPSVDNPDGGGTLAQGSAYIYSGSAWIKLLSDTTGLTQTMKMDFDQSNLSVPTVTVLSNNTIPAGAIILSSKTETFGAAPFNATGLTLAVGLESGDASFIQSTTDSDLTVNNATYIVPGPSGSVGSTAKLQLSLTCSGEGTTGTGSVIVEYVVPTN